MKQCIYISCYINQVIYYKLYEGTQLNKNNNNNNQLKKKKMYTSFDYIRAVNKNELSYTK